MKIGEPVVCAIEAQKGNGDSSHAKGQAYIFPDPVIVCGESVSKKLMEAMYPRQFEYLSYWSRFAFRFGKEVEYGKRKNCTFIKNTPR
jgi:hypothetical protein